MRDARWLEKVGGSGSRSRSLFTVVPLEKHREGTDLWAVENDLVSLTPLRLDLTDRDALASARQDSPLEDLPTGVVS